MEAIESEFEPVLVINNRPGKDEEILREFGEPAWNYQVVRFLDQEKADLIPRKDRIWSVEALAARMSEALSAAGREVPDYLKALGGVAAATDPSEAAFAMFCFWTGEWRLGGLDGVLTTEAGWLEGREVTRVTFDRAVISFEKLLAHAASFDCAQKVYVTSTADRKFSEASRLKTGTLDEGYRRANLSDQKRQISGTAFAKLNLSPVQATKINAVARSNPQSALNWLSPRQRNELTNS